ncbi:MAG: DEAD/DEAH box helicase [Acidimicrobiia bacterium]|nr:DEAD/DEAH box helicase [Acidimicrobiia bacterium]
MSEYGFPLDPFQLRAMTAIDEDRSVLVAAPTGSGKTVVAEHAVARALAGGGKAFYTAPIKALSNQKYADLVARYGRESVGLLTGDNSINGGASIVVMTTEVLRNMVYAGSPVMEGLQWVVIDEVHFLQDPYRGPVWEEVMIHLPAGVRLVCLSATVSNAEELAEWISTVRGPTEVVIEECRPVELRNLYCVGDKANPGLPLLPILVDGLANPEANRFDEGPRRGGGRRPFFTPRRVAVIQRLQDESMLPAITFIFSRKGCDEACNQLADAGLRLTTSSEAARVRAIVQERTASLAPADLVALGFDRFLAALEAGVAAHHAGMVPPFKEAVEACFIAGLTKAVFATETLAMGVNMPARSVVIERLSKFAGDGREMLTSGEYTQLTGRAGRRGIDDLGYAIVLWSPFVPFEEVAALALSRSFALRSAFRPTFNMAANLVKRYQPERAHHLLDLSFAQYQADRSVVRIEARIERERRRLARLTAEATCELGDVEEYRQQRAVAARPGGDGGTMAVSAALSRLAPGDLVVVDGAALAVVSVALRKGHPKVAVIDERGKPRTLRGPDLSVAPIPITTVTLPQPYDPHNRRFHHHVGETLRRAMVGLERSTEGVRNIAPGLAADTHPVADCPDRAAHLRAAGQAQRVRGKLENLQRQGQSRTESLARKFDRVLDLLEAWGYLDGWALTPAGEVLARTYHESDLLVAEALITGLFDNLDAPTMAAMASCFTYEHRGRDQPRAPRFPSSTLRGRFDVLEGLAADLLVDEEAAGLPGTRPPDAGFVHLAHAWASGTGLAEVLEQADLSGGDFVRNIKQLADLLRGLGSIAPVPATAARARQAAAALQRGVVTATSALPALADVERSGADS